MKDIEGPFGADVPRPYVVAGPCSLESRSTAVETARAMAEAVREAPIGLAAYRGGVWKPRTSPQSYTGPGRDGLPWLTEGAALAGVPAATEVATPEHVRQAADAGAALLWVGARTVSNPFAMEAVAEAVGNICPDMPVLVKNPLSPDIDLWTGALERLRRHGVRRLGAVHRGFSAYAPGPYRNAPGWHVAMELRRRMPWLTLLCDPSHMGGRADMVLPLSQRALDMGYDGLMIECHIDPSKALSDAAQQVTPQRLGQILRSLRPRLSSPAPDALDEMRQRLDALDHELLDILARRMALSDKIGQYKRQCGIPVVQPLRHSHVIDSRASQGADLGLDPAFVARLMDLVHEASVDRQLAKSGEWRVESGEEDTLQFP